MTGGPLKPDFGLSGDEAAWPLRTLGLVRPAFYANYCLPVLCRGDRTRILTLIELKIKIPTLRQRAREGWTPH